MNLKNYHDESDQSLSQYKSLIINIMNSLIISQIH